MNVLLSTHRGSITWYLNKKLTEASEMQRNQQEVRLRREVEKSKRYSIAWRKCLTFSMVNRPPPKFTPDKGLQPSSKRNKEIEAERQLESTLSVQQLQVLEQENNSMLEGFERTLDQIK